MSNAAPRMKKNSELRAKTNQQERRGNLKIVITDYRFPDVEQERRAVEAAGGTLVAGKAVNEDQVAELCRDADAVLNARAPVTRRAIAAMEHCRIIVRYGIGVDTIDVPAATERGIYVANVPDYCLDEVSDHALALLMMLSRQMIPGIALAREDTWAVAKMPPLQRLRGQTCGLFGCGRIGSLLAGKVSALGMSVVVHDPYLSEARAKEMGAERVSFDDLLARADFISLHAPLTDETRHIFGAAAFSRMKSNASIINTARGGLIDETALHRRARCGADFWRRAGRGGIGNGGDSGADGAGAPSENRGDGAHGMAQPTGPRVAATQGYRAGAGVPEGRKAVRAGQ